MTPEILNPPTGGRRHRDYGHDQNTPSNRMAQPPANYSAESMLPSPAHAAEIKVFQGGGGMPDGAQPQVSLYEQPVKPVEMVVYRGGGNGSEMSEADIRKLTFRGKTVEQLLTEEGTFLKPEHFIVFEKKNKAEAPYEVILKDIGKILVVPYTIEKKGPVETFSYVKGKYTTGKEVDLSKLFFYADSFDRSEAGQEDFQKTASFVLPFSTLLTPTGMAPPLPASSTTTPPPASSTMTPPPASSTTTPPPASLSLIHI